VCKISVIICTYNRCRLLQKAIESLIDQTLDKSLYEVIIVDNGSTDDTKNAAMRLASSYGNVRYLYEPRQGSGYARNTGVRNARGDIVAFLDDDARAAENWLEHALVCFEEITPTPLAIGGPIYPFYQEPKPIWFKDEYETRTWGDKPRFLKRSEAFSGSNMILRKEVYEGYGGCATNVGPKSNAIGVGEETALFEKIWQDNTEGVFLYYTPQLQLLHLVPSYRMIVTYRLKRAFIEGRDWYTQHPPESFPKLMLLFAGRFRSVGKLLYAAIAKKGTYSYCAQWLVECVAPIMRELGSLGLPIQFKEGGRPESMNL
jgi:glycosyltransferase involved in cell wall biosynthesis